mmetsp:Transcript_102734/g.294814  ORF Transcript_102734/g.294814 Transcript_102734/m.294814 type:complete len:265 (+) Transcript_102734:88-882(+)
MAGRNRTDLTISLWSPSYAEHMSHLYKSFMNQQVADGNMLRAKQRRLGRSSSQRPPPRRHCTPPELPRRRAQLRLFAAPVLPLLGPADVAILTREPVLAPLCVQEGAGAAMTGAMSQGASAGKLQQSTRRRSSRAGDPRRTCQAHVGGHRHHAHWCTALHHVLRCKRNWRRLPCRSAGSESCQKEMLCFCNCAQRANVQSTGQAQDSPGSTPDVAGRDLHHVLGGGCRKDGPLTFAGAPCRGGANECLFARRGRRHPTVVLEAR